jgi:hypothetical protein
MQRPTGFYTQIVQYRTFEGIPSLGAVLSVRQYRTFPHELANYWLTPHDCEEERARSLMWS